MDAAAAAGRAEPLDRAAVAVGSPDREQAVEEPERWRRVRRVTESLDPEPIVAVSRRLTMRQAVPAQVVDPVGQLVA
jgi:hypothetical protein